MYWVYRTQIFTWHNKPVQAILIDPTTRQRIKCLQTETFRSPLQVEPYGVDLTMTFEVNAKTKHPDNYFDSVGFRIYSERLVDLMFSFGVKAEVFPIELLDKAGNPLVDLKYFIFHSLEGILPVMDEEQSQWTGDRKIGIPRLVLTVENAENRPILLCNHIYVPLMRDDLKQVIEMKQITGFDFLRPEYFMSGQYGIPSRYNE